MRKYRIDVDFKNEMQKDSVTYDNISFYRWKSKKYLLLYSEVPGFEADEVIAIINVRNTNVIGIMPYHPVRLKRPTNPSSTEV